MAVSAKKTARSSGRQTAAGRKAAKKPAGKSKSSKTASAKISKSVSSAPKSKARTVKSAVAAHAAANSVKKSTRNAPAIAGAKLKAEAAAAAEAKRLAAAKAAKKAALVKVATKSQGKVDSKVESAGQKKPIKVEKQKSTPVAGGVKAKVNVPPPLSKPTVAATTPVVKAAPAIASGSTNHQTKVGIVNQIKLTSVATPARVAPVPGMRSAAPVQSAISTAKIEIKTSAKPGAHRTGFKSNEFIVYPAHGVGQIVAIEEQEVAGFKLELFVISFAKDKMTLKVPLPKVLNGAIRKLADIDTVKKALDTLTGRARIKRTMWSRRAQEYETKINSGDLGSIAEVVRDLYRSEAQPEQSYSERQLYEAALDRMAREVAAVHKVLENEALKMIETSLQKGPKRGARTETSGEAAIAVEIGVAA